MMACYRNASMLMHAAISAVDAVQALTGGRIREAAALLFRRSVAQSVWALGEELPRMRRLTRRHKRSIARKRSAPSTRQSSHSASEDGDLLPGR
jgi:hypothetical protein